MNSLVKKIELVANLAVIVLAIVAAVILIERFRTPRQVLQTPERQAQKVDISKLPRLGVDWSKSDRTLLLSLSKDCHFCTESAQFYQRLAQIRAKNPNIRLVAFFPQTVAEGQHYLEGLRVGVDEIREYPSGATLAKGTPTLVLVSRAGEVLGIWVGKLTPDIETEVAHKVDCGDDRACA